MEIYVAIKDVDVNQKLTSELIKLEKWPQNRIPDGAIFKLDDVENRYVRQRMYPGEPILAGKLTTQSWVLIPRFQKASAYSTCRSTSAMVVADTSSRRPSRCAWYLQSQQHY